MSNKTKRLEQAAELRRRSVDIAREKAAQLSENLEAKSPKETRQTLRKLRVHQIRLEKQNEETGRAQAEERIKSQLENFQRYQDVILNREAPGRELKREVNETLLPHSRDHAILSQRTNAADSETEEPKR